MKIRPLILIIAAAVFPGLSYGQNVSVREYTVPVSSARNLQVDFAFTYSATGSTVTSKNGNLVVFYKKFYDSLPFAYALDLNGSAILSHLNPIGDFDQNGRVNAVDAGILAGYLYLQGGWGATRADTARYRIGFDLDQDGKIGSSDTDVFTGYLGRKSTDDLTYRSSFVSRGKKYLQKGSKFFVFGDYRLQHSDTFDQPDMDATPGFGYGRFISATPLAKAVRIEEFLLKENAISDHLPGQFLIQLGHVIQKEGEYKERYGATYRKWWFEEMERAIVASGVAPKGIGAGGILRINEILFEQRVNERFYGWEATIGSNFQITAPISGQSRRDPGIALGIRYAWPLGWKHQISGQVDFSSPFTGQFGRVYNIGVTQDYIYEVSNRVDFILHNAIHVDVRERPPDPATFHRHRISDTLSAKFIFFIENKTNFSIGAQFDKSEGDPFYQTFSGTLNYRIF